MIRAPIFQTDCMLYRFASFKAELAAVNEVFVWNEPPQPFAVILSGIFARHEFSEMGPRMILFQFGVFVVVRTQTFVSAPALLLNMTTPNKSSNSQVGNSTRRSVAPTADENCWSAYSMSH